MTAPKFKVGDRVLHVESGGRYVITEMPPSAQMKVNGEWVACYGYRRFAPLPSQEGCRFYRTQAEMEDGRFVSGTRARDTLW